MLVGIVLWFVGGALLFQFFKSGNDLAFVTEIARKIKPFPFQGAGEMLLFYVMAFEVVSVFVVLAITQVFH